ncbi:hypothetical protein DICVIV_11413 [Dictyocaulus viviparus]|uniref:Uncharacterized protein n=1 Tax=Dictyocaulus viviparus TaxID=29172 RepID=A0A0D8XFV6_DICVI|nr:hypothetical protein DICVIV_11413 [Dictyocaulus viviparus]
MTFAFILGGETAHSLQRGSSHILVSLWHFHPKTLNGRLTVDKIRYLRQGGMSTFTSISGLENVENCSSSGRSCPQQLFDTNASDSDASSEERVASEIESSSRSGCLKSDRARDDQPGSSRGRALQQVITANNKLILCLLINDSC